MSAKRDFDYFVIGAGSGGVRSARIAASHGAKVGIAEGRFYGGTCVNVGCVPKKIFAYAADIRNDLEIAPSLGWTIDKESFDWETLKKNKDKEIERLNGIYENILKAANVRIFDDYAEFIDEHTLKIGSQTITADKILIATGGKPRPLSIPGGEHSINSDEAFALKELPKAITLYGGGYIAVEFAHIFHNMGVDTTLVYRGDLFLRDFDEDIRKDLADEMRRKGIKLLFNTEITKIDAVKPGDYTLTFKDGKTAKTGLVMAAIGRTPETARLNLGKAGVKTKPNGAIPVNDRFETNVPHIFAVGDIIEKLDLTPVALAQGHILADRLFAQKKRKNPDYSKIATAIFSDPPISTVGLSEEKARAEGYDIDVYMSRFTPLKHQLSGGKGAKTTMKMIVDRKSDKILGIHILGLDAPEMMQGFAVAFQMGATKADFDATIGMHPTSAEELVTMRTPRPPKK